MWHSGGKTGDLPRVNISGFPWPGWQASGVRRRGPGGVSGGGSHVPGPPPGPWNPPGRGRTLPRPQDASWLLSAAAGQSLQTPAHSELSSSSTPLRVLSRV